MFLITFSVLNMNQRHIKMGKPTVLMSSVVSIQNPHNKVKHTDGGGFTRLY